MSTFEQGGIVYVDVPGLLEADEECIQRNEACVVQALSLPNGLYKLAFVFGMGNGGRLDSRDILAYKRICAGSSWLATTYPHYL